MLDNLPNRGLCLMHNFFLYGTVENFAIYPNFIRCVHDSVLCVVLILPRFTSCMIVYVPSLQCPCADIYPTGVPGMQAHRSLYLSHQFQARAQRGDHYRTLQEPGLCVEPKHRWVCTLVVGPSKHAHWKRISALMNLQLTRPKQMQNVDTRPRGAARLAGPHELPRYHHRLFVRRPPQLSLPARLPLTAIPDP